MERQHRIRSCWLPSLLWHEFTHLPQFDQCRESHVCHNHWSDGRDDVLYRLKVVDTSGNLSGYSAEVTKRP